MKRTGTVTVQIRYKLRRMYGDPDEDYDEDYSKQEIEMFINDAFEGIIEGDGFEASVKKITFK